MSEKILTDSTALALGGTTDSVTEAVYPQTTQNNWAAVMFRWMRRTLQALALGNEFRVYEVDGNADAVGIRAGRARIGSTTINYAGADPALDGLTNNATTRVWLTAGGTIGSSSSAYPATVHHPLAEVVMSGGVITAINDRRGWGWSDRVLPSYTTSGRPSASLAGRAIWNTTTSKINIDTGSAWVLADGTSA